jgi:hypothetical protein
MTPQEKMIELLYKAAAEGGAKLVKSGMAFLVMTGAICMLSWALIFMYNENKAQVRELKSDFLNIRIEYATQIIQLREEIAECNRAREEQAIKVAKLETIIQKLKK